MNYKIGVVREYLHLIRLVILSIIMYQVNFSEPNFPTSRQIIL